MEVPPPVRPPHLPQQDGAPIPQLRHPPAELVARVQHGERLRPGKRRVAAERLHPPLPRLDERQSRREDTFDHAFDRAREVAGCRGIVREAFPVHAAEFLREMMEPGTMTPNQQRHAEELLTACSGGVWTPEADRNQGFARSVVAGARWLHERG